MLVPLELLEAVSSCFANAKKKKKKKKYCKWTASLNKYQENTDVN